MEDFKADDPSMMFLRGLLGAVGGIAQRNKVGNIVMSGLRGGLMGARAGQEAPTEFSVGDSLLGAFAGFPAGMGYKQLSEKELAKREKEKKRAEATLGVLADLGAEGHLQNVGYLAGPLGGTVAELFPPSQDLSVFEEHAGPLSSGTTNFQEEQADLYRNAEPNENFISRYAASRRAPVEDPSPAQGMGLQEQYRLLNESKFNEENANLYGSGEPGANFVPRPRPSPEELYNAYLKKAGLLSFSPDIPLRRGGM